jgi:ABC-type antimicrobial peptide transport system permease subunit
MIKNIFKVALRNLVRNKIYSFINIAGLATGMAVALLIGLWIHDELSFNKGFDHYNRVGQLWQFVKFDAEKSSYNVMPIPLAKELRSKYPEFKYVSLSSNKKFVLAAGDKQLTETGNYVEPDFAEMMSVKMLSGSRSGLNGMNNILLSESLAKAFFGSANPINRLIKIDNKSIVKVAGIYRDFPDNSSFKEVHLLATWELYAATDEGVKNSTPAWDDNSYEIYAQLQEGTDFKKVSAKIRDIRMKMDNPPGYKPEFFVFPMSRWHLYSDFKDGVNTGGLISFVRLFAVIGIFVLLLACINFMNLSTARSEKRAKEVGIRKTIGSARWQLITQFLGESLLMVASALVLSLILAQLALPFFNEVSGKQITIPWSDPFFCLAGLGFSLLTGLIAGSYPAFYLSSFRPVKVLKSVFRAGRLATIPRKVLVVLQFTVSVILIIGTIVVFRQIEFARDRPVGYNRNRLIEVSMNTPELSQHFDALRTDLLNTGAVSAFSESSCPISRQWGGTTDTWWKGKNPQAQPLMMANSVTHDFGKTVGWQLEDGRDFSHQFSTDTSAIILNESAVKTIGFKHPLEGSVTVHGKPYQVIGVIKDMIRESPFEPVKPTFFLLDYRNLSVIDIKLAPQSGTAEALGKIEKVFRKHNPGSPFTYSFVDADYNSKFTDEERIGRLARFFAVLAIFISCLGLFGLASFVAEQRTREIGVRKVLGATVLNVWVLLSGEFLLLVGIAFLIAVPVAYHFMYKWLQNYGYRTSLSTWIFLAAGAGTILITLITVSFQAIRAALANPVKSLRTE